MSALLPQRLRTPASLARLERRQQLTTGVTNNYAFEPPPASADAEARAATIGRQDVPNQQGGPTFTGAGDFSGGFDQLQRAFRQFRRYVELLNLHAVCLARMVAGIDILDLRIDPKKHIIALGQVSSLVE